MVQYKVPAHELIKNEFTPHVAILHSSSVDKICQKNNLSFVELLQPFSKINADVYMEDGNGGVIITHNLKITLKDVNFRPLQPQLANKILSMCVSSSKAPKIETIHAGGYNLEIPVFARWFESWRSSFLNLQYPSDHEFTKHYLACILVVSSAEDNPVETMNQLVQSLNQLQTPSIKQPKWFNSSVLRYYLIVHDNIEGDQNKATQSMEAFKVSFGTNNCFLLQINSRPATEPDQIVADPWNQYISPYYNTVGFSRYSPDISPNSFRTSTTPVETYEENMLPYHPLSPNTESFKLIEPSGSEESSQEENVSHGGCLTTEDIEQIKLFIHEFCTKALVPYVERLIQNLNDMVTNKKGVGKSLFSATKRWFAPGKMGSSNGVSNLLIYPYEAPELQFRRLGDLYFMFGHYNLAYQVYHACKQDFSTDQAWFYYAGALEMASLSAFMANEPTRKSIDYIEEAIVTYLDTCKLPQFATRATLFSIECLKFRNLHGEAAHQLIRMTGEESDLRSALFLEQAAACFLDTLHPQMARKYAFHMVLAGHRFSKSSQKKHALRCYKQALQVYHSSRWAFAEDHVHYTIGKLSTILNDYKEAVKSFALLLTIESKQSVEQQTLFLEEYLSLQRMLLKDQDVLHSSVLVLPLVKSDSLKILVGPTPPLSIPRKVRALGVSFDSHDNPAETEMWNKLEEIAIQEAQGSLPITFKAAVVLYTKHNISNTKITAIVNELIQVSVVVHNPLSVPLILQDVYLLWEFEDLNTTITTNDGMDKKCNLLLKAQVLKSFLAQSNSSQDLILSLTPPIIGKLQLKGISYSIYNSYNSEDIVFVTGKQYFDIQQLGLFEVSSLEISVTPPAPCLQVTFSEIHSEILCNQIQCIQMEMRNAGHVPLHKSYIATSKPQYFSTCEFYNEIFQFKEVVTMDHQGVQEREGYKNHVYSIPLPNNCLEPGQSHYVNLWLKAPCIQGPISIDLLIYYESNDAKNGSRYRLIRHSWKLNVYRSLEVSLNVIEGCNSQNTQELLFVVKMTNMNKKHQNVSTKISITNVILLSSLWNLESMGNCTRSTLLSSKESTCVLLKGTRCVKNSIGQFKVALSNEQFCNEMAYLDFGQRIKQNILNVFDNAPLTNTDSKIEGILLFQWVAEVNISSGAEFKANGQSSIFVEKVEQHEDTRQHATDATSEINPAERPLEDLASEATHDKLDTQISLCLSHNDFVYHNFKLHTICIIPIEVVIHNNSAAISLVTVNSINDTDTSSSFELPITKTSLSDLYPPKNYWWVSVNKVEKIVAPFNTEKMIFQIAITSPGVYDLGGRLEVWCFNELHNDPILQIVHISNFITVENVSTT